MAEQGNSPAPTNVPNAKQNKNKRRGKKHNSPSPKPAAPVSEPVLAKNSPRAQGTPKQKPQQPNHTNNHSNNKQRNKSLHNGNGSSTPLKEQAYAGAEFQNSPAASSLPIPKLFLAKMAAKAASEKSSSSSNTSPELGTASPVPVRQDVKSPLDIFFDADRAEKKQLQESTTALKQILFGPAATPAASSTSYQQYNASPSPLQHSASGPATPAAMPYQQNNYFYGNKQLSPMFQAARGVDAGSFPQQQNTVPAYATQAQPQYYSPAYMSPHQSAAGPANHTASMTPPPAFNPAYPQQQYGSNQHTNAAFGQSPRNASSTNDVPNMEDNIRRMLKLSTH